MKTNKKSIVVSVILVVIVFYGGCGIKGTEYYQPEPLATHFNGEHFVGSLTCIECHSDIYNTHIHTAHYNTSALPSSTSIKGSFEEGENTVGLSGFEIEMKQKGETYYQQIRMDNSSRAKTPQEIDIVVGSGVKGQSFFTWEEEALFQLQASYYPPTDSWINSPGFPSQPNKRPIRDGCLKCHVTFATNLDFSGKGNKYDKEKMILGVDCEKCHRPAEKHVVFHRENPTVDTATYMLKLDTLSRQLRLDACAQCHSGSRAGIIKGNSFSYLVGERLDEYSRNFYTGQKSTELDVHGNQYGLLTSSKCFMNSPEMDCGTCHDPHKNQRGDTSLFNQKCMSCHNSNTVHCTEDTAALDAMANNCISCHMPTVQSESMSVQLGASHKETGVLVRTHLIGIYDNDEDSKPNQLDTTTMKQIKGFIDSK